ncbi:glucan endo-1,3-beta-glucosidase 14 [Dorcoceras hygrometricum]|uniref:Glucan endo-1,3-beta-glucosidase 14 n=1 Tax=Dorcoceras hygrometricum TaxID=472368 RepID=A0A2Z7CBR1_9LAMI|nr:glucan endo-1,3-beta-glucosidase 14 [Dorcoceras hygrometricum]
MDSKIHLTAAIFSFLFLFPFLRYALCDPGTVGINYGRIVDHLPPPPQVVKLLQGHGFTKVKLYDTDSGISVIVALPNEQLSSAAAGRIFYGFMGPIQYPRLPSQNSDRGHCLRCRIRTFILWFVQIGPLGAGNQTHVEFPETEWFLSEYLMVNAHPFFAYTANTDTISLDYALFRDNPGVTDPNNGLVYKSLFEGPLDAVFAAMNALGFNDIKVVVSETGWPSKGDENEIGGSEPNAAAYNGNCKRQVKAKLPTPSSGGDTGYFSTSTVGQTWCVANEQAGGKRLQAALDYACGEAGADCRQIQPGAACYNPNNLVAHASYAFNNFYQRNGRDSLLR